MIQALLFPIKGDFGCQDSALIFAWWWSLTIVSGLCCFLLVEEAGWFFLITFIHYIASAVLWYQVEKDFTKRSTFK